MFVENLVLVISCLGVVQAVLICVYLFSVRDKKGNMFLALTLLGLIMIVLKSVLNNYMGMPSWLRVIGISGSLIIGPCLWFYGQSLFEKRDLSKNNFLKAGRAAFPTPRYHGPWPLDHRLFHLVPFVIFDLLCWAIPNGADFTSYLVASLVFFHLAAYLVVCWRYILKDRESSRLLPWYRGIVIGVTVIWFLYVGIFIGFIPLYILGAVFFSFLIYIFSYLLLKRHVFALEKYGSSAISPGTSKQLLEQVKALFETKEIYLESTVSLKVVAEKLSTSAREVSQAINEHGQKNFSEFVNHYRVARAKVLLADPARQHEKIETIAYDCGFGNVTSFNLAFKAETGITPSQYRNQFSVA